MMTPARLANIKARADAASAGPWERVGERLETPGMHIVFPETSPMHPQFLADVDFIAHARQDVPDLVARVEELETALARVLAMRSMPGHWHRAGDALCERIVREVLER